MTTIIILLIVLTLVQAGLDAHRDADYDDANSEAFSMDLQRQAVLERAVRAQEGVAAHIGVHTGPDLGVADVVNIDPEEGP